MEIVSIQKNIHTSPRKLRLVAECQQGLAFNEDWPGNGPPDTDNRPGTASDKMF